APAAAEHRLLEIVGEAARDREGIGIDLLVGPFAGEPDIAPRAHRCAATLAIDTEDRVELLQREALHRVVVVHEDDDRIAAIARLVAPRHHVDARRVVALHLAERGDLERPDLAAHEGEVACAGVERAHGGGGPRETVLELHAGMERVESLLPFLDERLDEIEAPGERAMAPEPDVPRDRRGRRHVRSWKVGLRTEDGANGEESEGGGDAKDRLHQSSRFLCARASCGSNGTYAPSRATSACPSALST